MNRTTINLVVACALALLAFGAGTISRGAVSVAEAQTCVPFDMACIPAAGRGQLGVCCSGACMCRTGDGVSWGTCGPHMTGLCR